MQGIQKFFLSIFVFSFWLVVSCGGPSHVWDGSPVHFDLPVATSTMIIMPDGMQTPQENTGQSITDGGSPTAANRQSIVSGSVSVEGYQSGSVDVMALEAAACDKGYCPMEGKPPLASIKVPGQGYFSLIVPHYGQAVVLKGAHLSPDQTSYQAQLYLGGLGARKDDATLILKAQ